ncbi:MAG: class I adenylate-forming enzyme family protein [Pseudodonghicola sp.]
MLDNRATELARRAAGLTLKDELARAFADWPDRIALEQDGRGLSYAALDDRSRRLADALAARGLRHGDRIALLSENRTEYLELLVTAARAGLILCAQNWRLAPEELRHCVDLVAPALIVASPRFADQARALWPQADLLVLGPDYEAAIAAARPVLPDHPVDPEDGVVILYTSGTTGRPKGALISQRAMVARAHVMAMDLPCDADDAFVAWAPLFHMVSTDPSLATLMRGGTVIVADGFDAAALAGLTVSRRIGHLVLMPGMIAEFLDAFRAIGRPARGVKWVGVMADLVPRRQLQEVTTALNAPYVNSFGSTETGAPPATAGTVPVGVLPETLDKTVSSLCQIRLLDEDGCEVAEGAPGALAIRAPTLFSGYWRNPEATEDSFRDGWFHMGDVFRRTAPGKLAFVDRRKYLIKSGGENIYPAEIEQVILALPAVRDAVVVRRADDRWGEVPVAFVVARDGEALDAATVLAGCDGPIARYKRPREVFIVADAALPRSTTGKIMRHELEQALSDGRLG